jgi:DNA replication protein DnaC
MDSLYSAALMTENQKQHIALRVDADGTDLEQFKQLAGIEQNICKFVEEGKNLYLHSAIPGNGKSSWALRLIEAYFNKIWARSEAKCRVLFISVPRFLLAIKDNITNKSSYVEYIKENVLEADLVVWDDLAAKVGSEFELSHLLSIIDNRLSLGKSNIYTSNLNRQQLYTALGERLTSRVANMSIDIELFGSDKRNLKLEDN